MTLSHSSHVRGYSKNSWDLYSFGNAGQGMLTSPTEGYGVCEVFLFVFKKTSVIQVLNDDCDFSTLTSKKSVNG